MSSYISNSGAPGCPGFARDCMHARPTRSSLCMRARPNARAADTQLAMHRHKSAASAAHHAERPTAAPRTPPAARRNRRRGRSARSRRAVRAGRLRVRRAVGAHRRYREQSRVAAALTTCRVRRAGVRRLWNGHHRPADAVAGCGVAAAGAEQPRRPTASAERRVSDMQGPERKPLAH